MALSAFSDKRQPPGSDDLRATLGRTFRLWNELEAHAAAEFSPLDKTWNFAGANWGWSMRLKQKKRTVLYMTPCAGHFLVGFALGEKAVQAAHDAELPALVLELVDTAKKYAEGRAVRLEVRNKNDLRIAGQIAAIKMAN